MSQTRTASLVEAIINVLIGYCVALASQLVIFPRYGIEVSLSTNVTIGMWFTAISIIRSYVLRRLFNRIGSPAAWMPYCRGRLTLRRSNGG